MYFQCKVVHNGNLTEDGYDIGGIEHQGRLTFGNLLAMKDKLIKEKVCNMYENERDFDFSHVYMTIVKISDGSSMIDLELEEILKWCYTSEAEIDILNTDVYEIKQQLKSLKAPMRIWV